MTTLPDSDHELDQHLRRRPFMGVSAGLAAVPLAAAAVVGDGRLWAGALHPDIDEVKVSFDGAAPFDADTFTHEGGTYFAVEAPPDTATFTVDYLSDGQFVVPPAGETAQHTMARD
jgi:hypothetical protein